jgi:hypothetical protein
LVPILIPGFIPGIGLYTNTLSKKFEIYQTCSNADWWVLGFVGTSVGQLLKFLPDNNCLVLGFLARALFGPLNDAKL